MSNNGFIKNRMLHFAAAQENTTAFSFFDGNVQTNITYHQFVDDILKAAGYFKANNIIRQHIALAAPNSYDWLVAAFAIMVSGNTLALMNPSLPADLLQWQYHKADITMLCSEDSLAEELCPSNAGVKFIPFSSLWGCKPISMCDVYSASPEETNVLLFTSGTTGQSKVVELSSHNLENALFNLAETHGKPGMEKVFTILPLFHVAGFFCLFQTTDHYHTLCLGRGPKYVFMDMPVLNPTNISLVPAILDSIVKMYRVTKNPEDRQRFVGTSLQNISVGGAMITVSTIRFMLEQGITIDTLYGMTETAGDGIRCVLDEAHAGALGKLSGNMQCRLQDGEILLKNDSIMKGYYKDPEETAKIIEDGWIHTGDLGYCDADGYYYITGRKKNVIILSNGENINPEEVEATLGKSSAILECLVFSDGKGICADVYTEDQPSAMEFIKAYNADSPFYRQIYKVNYVDQPLEKTPTGKIKRKGQ